MPADHCCKRITFSRVILSAITQFLFLLSIAFPSGGAEFTVNSTHDVNDLEPGNGLCVAYLIVFPPFVLPFCTLRAAIEESNALPGPDSISIPSGNYQLSIEGIGEDGATTGDLDINDILRISGNGARKTSISGNDLDRVFDIPNQHTEVYMEHLGITNGKLPGHQKNIQQGGGGIRNRGSLTLQNVLITNNLFNGTAPANAGGGILNLANCIIHDSTIMENNSFIGGGIYNGPEGNLAIYTSTINKNTADSGGGLANEGTATIANTTISGNQADKEHFPSGGGIYNTFTLEIFQSTITGNTSLNGGGGISNEGNIKVANTIVAGNSNTNCSLSNPINSLGNNLDSDNSCLFESVTDIILADPRLSSLQDHGGPTKTHGLLIGSPAVDNGQDLSAMGIIKDQRGRKRPDGNKFDIGAFETRKRSITPLLTPLLCCDR